jgi:hypothetical protein
VPASSGHKSLQLQEPPNSHQPVSPEDPLSAMEAEGTHQQQWDCTPRALLVPCVPW